MVKKTEKGWQVQSKSGKVLSDNLTESQARELERKILAYKYAREKQVANRKFPINAKPKHTTVKSTPK